jgi:TRAP-type C4-dicarboxylate transport system permease small subunit
MIQKFEDLASMLLRFIATFALVVLFWLILINVIARTFELAGFAWFDEIVRGSFAYMVFFGAASLWLTRDHFQVNWLEQSLSNAKAKWLLRSVVAILCLSFLFVMTYYGWILVSKANALTPILQIPERLFYVAIPISGAIMAVHTVIVLVAETRDIFLQENESK